LTAFTRPELTPVDALFFGSSTIRLPALYPCRLRMSGARPSSAFAVNRVPSQVRGRGRARRLRYRYSLPRQVLPARPALKASLGEWGNPARVAGMDRRDPPARKVRSEWRVRLARKAIQGLKARRGQPVLRVRAVRLPQRGCLALSVLLARKVRPDRLALRDLRGWPDTRVRRAPRGNRDRGASPVLRGLSDGMDRRGFRERQVPPARRVLPARMGQPDREDLLAL
jgi:hypothetical protein